VEYVHSARTSDDGEREYFVEYSGYAIFFWDPFSSFIINREIYVDTAERIAELDSLTDTDIAEMNAREDRDEELGRCALSVCDCVVRDHDERFACGTVVGGSSAYVNVKLDDVTEILCAPRDQLLKVMPLAEPIGVADCCRIAYDDMDAINKYRWFYGKVLGRWLTRLPTECHSPSQSLCDTGPWSGAIPTITVYVSFMHGTLAWYGMVPLLPPVSVFCH
jgi:hypothetical protein